MDRHSKLRHFGFDPTKCISTYNGEIKVDKFFINLQYHAFDGKDWRQLLHSIFIKCDFTSLIPLASATTSYVTWPDKDTTLIINCGHNGTSRVEITLTNFHIQYKVDGIEETTRIDYRPSSIDFIRKCVTTPAEFFNLTPCKATLLDTIGFGATWAIKALYPDALSLYKYNGLALYKWDGNVWQQQTPKEAALEMYNECRKRAITREMIQMFDKPRLPTFSSALKSLTYDCNFKR